MSGDDLVGVGGVVDEHALLEVALQELRDAEQWRRIAGLWLGHRNQAGENLMMARGYLDLLLTEGPDGGAHLRDDLEPIKDAAGATESFLQRMALWLRGTVDPATGVCDMSAIAMRQAQSIATAVRRPVRVSQPSPPTPIAIGCDSAAELLTVLAQDVADGSHWAATVAIDVHRYPAHGSARPCWGIVRVSAARPGFTWPTSRRFPNDSVGIPGRPGADLAFRAGGIVVEGEGDDLGYECWFPTEPSVATAWRSANGRLVLGGGRVSS